MPLGLSSGSFSSSLPTQIPSVVKNSFVTSPKRRIPATLNFSLTKTKSNYTATKQQQQHFADQEGGET
jgi:hypothetical protein